ncbi:MAG: response regulator [Deltaproteobacteria bacterium]|nr:response regulator [Deltaproteobacteria bacterium]MBW2051451.1 response regulator [Deltaproteobacteria bacterium]MBW2140679.1 response regulator [Deltaproteobacteria bacterium]MBW2322639.1 response regulator [Deltaproteobacteria bacterium]
MKYQPSNILLVEDEEAHAELTKRAIRKTGNANRIDIVPDGEQALDYLMNCGDYSDKAEYPCPGLIILDIKLPGIDGIEVLKTIKQHPAVRQIPVIMLTTSENEADIEQSYKNYANSYLIKPVGFQEFEEKVMQIDSYWMLLNKPPSF